MGIESQCGLKMLFFPLMAHGHMLPMLDMAKLFALRGVEATILTTPANAHLVQPFVDRANDSGSVPGPMRLLLVPFPPDTGLPAGCENLSSIPPEEMPNHFSRFIDATEKLRGPFGGVLRELLPDCVVTDMFFPWTYDAAAELGVPRLVFHGLNLFSLCIADSFDRYRPLERLSAEASSLVIPGLPHRVELLTSQIPSFEKATGGLARGLQESESKSYGVLVNSFYELEPDYARHYREVVGRRAWLLGPLALCHGDGHDNAGRRDACLEWLDSRSRGSVVYVCFGSMSDFSAAQLREMALGLEASGRPFVWVVRKGGKEWAPEGFEERVGGRGLVVRGWAPQIPILNHPSVGGFVTHCGWNSSLEGVSTGLPLATWPLFADQVYNEKLIVEVLRIGVSIWRNEEDRGDDGVVAAAMIRKAVEELMGRGEDARERRRRARELGKTARRVVGRDGSSYNDMSNLVIELVDKKAKQFK
ncbi:scopoletin glucosyltransferase-like [Iris pallida]|uniref:Glycosyltransferase n=1 Tax=Iris pallida TaxID=29817 RepID=A0AAX6DLQ0_IRIPA|nr:scopoletin glucosyltransferase-like [Iris pallida]